MTASASQIVLAIAPGKREFGVAVFRGAELVYFAVKTLKRKNSTEMQQQEINALLRGLIKVFKPDRIAVKAINQYQQTSTPLREIVRLIKLNALASEFVPIDVTLKQMKSAIYKGEKPMLKSTFSALAVLYPELKQYLNRPNKWQNDYYSFLFSAVAVGFVCLHSCSNAKSSQFFSRKFNSFLKV